MQINILTNNLFFFFLVIIFFYIFRIIHKNKENKIQNFNIIQKDILYLNRDDV